MLALCDGLGPSGFDPWRSHREIDIALGGRRCAAALCVKADPEARVGGAPV